MRILSEIKPNKMKVKDLIQLLKKCDLNSEVRTVKETEEDLENQWVYALENDQGEVRLITSE